MVDLDNYDAVHFHSTLDLFLLRETLNHYRGKVILTSHSPQPLSQEITDKFNSFEKVLVGEKAINDFIMFDKYAFERADYVIFPCEDAEEPYVNRWPDFIKIKHQNPDKFKYCLTGTIRAEAKIPRSDIRTKYKIPNDAFVLCFVGRHNKIKGYDRFIRIAENLMQKDENIYALVAGDPGPVPSPQQKRWIEVGWTNDPHSIINASDIFLLPNEETYFDMVLLEVLSLGVPIVTTNTGGNKYFGDKYEPGISLFDTDDQCENIISRIKCMSIGELNTIKEKNQAFYNENFTPKAFAERYVKVIFYITSLGGGGAEKVLVELLKGLAPDKYNLDITLVTLFEGIRDKEVPDYVRHVIYAPNASESRKRLIQRLCYRAPKLMSKFIFHDMHCDVGVAYMEGITTSVMRYFRGMKKKVTFLHEGLKNSHFLENYYGSIDKSRKEYASYDQVCFVSEEVRKEFEAYCGESKKHRVVHNVMNISEVVKRAEEPVTETYSPDTVHLVTVGRLSPQKKIDRVLRAALRLEKEFAIEWWVLGTGELQDDLMSLKEELGVQSVKFLGYKNNPYPYICKADLMVVTSEYEGYVTAAYEANILGIPVLSTDCSGARECIGDDGGVIVPNSLEGIIKGIRDVLEDTGRLKELKSRAAEKSIYMKNKSVLEFTDMIESLN